MKAIRPFRTTGLETRELIIMNKTRMEAFSDGVIAILITIMIFDIKAPQDTSSQSLWTLAQAIMTYLMSFLYLGIYWNNHHHLLVTVKRVSGGVLWANLHLLFWLSLLPVMTNWMRLSGYAAFPTAAYGVVLLFAALAYKVLQSALIHAEGPQSRIRIAIGGDIKGWFSIVSYVFATTTAIWFPLVSLVVYCLVAAIWLIPDRRIESVLERE